MNFFAGKLNEPKIEKERNYLDVEYKYREIAKKCAKLYFDWDIKEWYTYEDVEEFNKKFLRAKFDYESNKMKTAINYVQKTNANDMLLKQHKEKTLVEVKPPAKKSDYFN